MGLLFDTVKQAEPHNCTTCLHELHCSRARTCVWCPDWRARETNNNAVDILRNCARRDTLTALERGELEDIATEMERDECD